MDGRFRVEAGGDARRDRIELNTRAPGTGIQPVRHQTKEVPNTHGRLEDVRAWLEAQIAPSPARLPE